MSDEQRIYDRCIVRVGQLEAENEKLRELVRDLWRFTGTACKKYPRLFDQSAQGGQMVMLNMIDSFEQRLRELGVEYNYMHESRPPRTLAELFGVWRNCDDEEDE